MAGEIKVWKVGATIFAHSGLKTPVSGNSTEMSYSAEGEYYWFLKNGEHFSKKHWSMVLNDSGSSFSTQQETEGYLSDVFSYQKEHIRFIDLPLLT